VEQWNTMVASSFWDMRLSIACAATDAEYQNRIIIHDNTINLPVVEQQLHPVPNYAPHTTAPRGQASACHSLDNRSPQLHAAACLACCMACCTTLYLALFMNF